jgi:hypothetical protein
MGRWDLIYMLNLPEAPEYSALKEAAMNRLIALGASIRLQASTALEDGAMTRKNWATLLEGLGETAHAGSVTLEVSTNSAPDGQQPQGGYWAFFALGLVSVGISIIVGIRWAVLHARRLESG